MAFGHIIARLGTGAALAAGLMLSAGPAVALDGPSCSTVPQASDVIAGSPSPRALTGSVAQSVPSDPANCVPSYCVASRDENEEIQMAVGAGIAEAFARLDGQDGEQAAALNTAACSADCGETVARSYSAARSLTLEEACASSSASGSGSSPSLLKISAGGGGGGSPN